jgi:hypothetical protein
MNNRFINIFDNLLISLFLCYIKVNQIFNRLSAKVNFSLKDLRISKGFYFIIIMSIFCPFKDGFYAIIFINKTSLAS